MRHITFLLILFSSISLVAQTNSDTALPIKKTLPKLDDIIPDSERPSTGKLQKKDSLYSIEGVKIVGLEIHGCGLVETRSYVNPKGIVHVNHSYFGLPTYPFRFNNVNQMANTVAGVFSVEGETPSIRGARREATAYYIDGVRIVEGFLPITLE